MSRGPFLAWPSHLRATSINDECKKKKPKTQISFRNLKQLTEAFKEPVKLVLFLANLVLTVTSMFKSQLVQHLSPLQVFNTHSVLLLKSLSKPSHDQRHVCSYLVPSIHGNCTPGTRLWTYLFNTSVILICEDCKVHKAKSLQYASISSSNKQREIKKTKHSIKLCS